MNPEERVKTAPPGFQKGIDEFNQRQFFECHETLESVWHDQPDPERELTQGIIQIAVGYYHYGRNNKVGALKLLNRGVERVEKFLPAQFDLALDKFAKHVRTNIREIGDDNGSPIGLNIPQIEIFAD